MYSYKKLLISILILFACSYVGGAQTTIVVPPTGNLQSAINAANCGDKIVLQAGATYFAPADFVAYTLPVKPCTDANPITITSSVPAPADGKRVGKADRANMPKLVARVGSPGFFDVQNRAHHYRFSHLWFTNQKRADGSGTTYLIGGGLDNTGDINLFPHHILVDHCFFNPVEWDEDNEQNLYASVNYAVEIGGSNITVRDSHMDGFGAKYANDKTTILDSGCLLIGVSPGPYTMQNNYCAAWFVGFFVGGGDPGTSNRATVQASTTTSLTLSQTANLQPGDYISYRVPESHPDNPFGDRWGASIVESISGNQVQLRIPTQVTGLDHNKRNGPAALVGGEARWRGWIPSDISILRNDFYKPPRWYQMNGSDGKGFFEIKLCDRCVIDGNRFDGNTGFTITVRNQGGAAAWSVIKNLTMSNNLVTRFADGFATLFDDNQRLSMRSSNIRFVNNLMYGDVGPDPTFGLRPRTTVLASGGVDGVEISHNTIMQTGEIVRYTGLETSSNFVWKDNITNWGTGTQHGFFCLKSSTGSAEDCVPGYTWTKSVMIGAPTGPIPFARSMASFPAGNFNPATIAGVGFVDPANNNYRLRADSPFAKKGTDGKDIGVDMDQLLAHLGGTATAPLPTPTPIPSTSPTPAPSPVASPSPQPSPSATPISTPTPQPIPPANSVSIVRVLVRELAGESDTPVAGATVSVAGKEMLSRAEDGYAWFDQQPTSLGSIIVTTKEGYEFPRVTVVEGTVEQLYFVVGRRAAQPSPTPAPTPTSVPSPQPSPQPTPIPSPVPSPTPPPLACEMALTVPTLAQWSTGVLKVNLTAPLPTSFTLTATADSGQITVMPRTQTFSNVTSLTTEFKLQSKKKSANVVVSGPCGSKTVMVVIR